MTDSRPPTPVDAGFTLLEVIGALLLVAIVTAGAAAVVTTSAASIRAARLETVSVLAASEKVAQMLSLAWSRDPRQPLLGSADLTTDVSAVPWSGGGSGLSISATDSLAASVDGSVDYLDARGTWIGRGVSPPPGATFVRRWRVSGVPGASVDAIAIQVFVTLAAAPATPVAAARARRPGHVLLTAIHTRKGA